MFFPFLFFLSPFLENSIFLYLFLGFSFFSDILFLSFSAFFSLSVYLVCALCIFFGSLSLDTFNVNDSNRYLVRPSPFSAQKTFERHNSRRKSNISYCSNLNMAQAAASASRRGSGFCLNTLQNMPGYGLSHRSASSYIVQNKSNSLSLPDSPTVAGQTRGRSNSLRVSIFEWFPITNANACEQMNRLMYANLIHFSNLNRSKAIFCYGAQVHCVRAYQMLAYRSVDASLHSKRSASATLPHWCRPQTTQIRSKFHWTEVSD